MGLSCRLFAQLLLHHYVAKCRMEMLMTLSHCGPQQRRQRPIIWIKRDTCVETSQHAGSVTEPERLPCRTCCFRLFLSNTTPLKVKHPKEESQRVTSSRRATAGPFLPGAGAGAGAGAARWAKRAAVRSLQRCAAPPARCSEAQGSYSPHPLGSGSSSRTRPTPGTGAWPQAWGRGVLSHPHPSEPAWAGAHALTQDGSAGRFQIRENETKPTKKKKKPEVR